MGEFEPSFDAKTYEVQAFYEADNVVDIYLNVPLREDGMVHVSDIDYTNRVRVDLGDPEQAKEWEGKWLSPAWTEWTSFGVNVGAVFHLGDEPGRGFVPFGGSADD